MFGAKPWQGYRNHEVAVRVERGEILHQPPGCPDTLYEVIKAMWRLDVAERITAAQCSQCFDALLCPSGNRGKFPPQLLPLLLNNNSNDKEPPTKYRQPLMVAAAEWEALEEAPNTHEPTSSSIPSTIEQQIMQSAEDERWLEEEERKLLPDEALMSRVAHSRTDTCVAAAELPVEGDTNCLASPSHDSASSIHQSVLQLVQAVSALSKSYSDQPSNEQFLTVAEVRLHYTALHSIVHCPTVENSNYQASDSERQARRAHPAEWKCCRQQQQSM